MQFYAVPTANEKQALWFLAVVALCGSGVRIWRARVPAASSVESAALTHQLERVDSVREVRHLRGGQKSTRQRGQNGVAATGPVTSADDRGIRIDLDAATAQEIETLPGIGPALAKRIVAARDSSGGLGQIEALCLVNGIGPSLVEKLRPLVTFTGARRPLSDACGGSSKRPRKARVTRSREPR